MLTENDCEDTGWSRIEDGCMNWKCQTWEPGAKTPTHPKLEKQERHGALFWVCPKCGGSYGHASHDG
jgi:hypothetical protein